MSRAPEFSYRLEVQDLPSKGVRVKLEADGKECAALAKRLGLVSLDAFKAEAEVKPWRKSGVSVRGHFTAEVTQSCVVTLEPVKDKVADEFEAYFLPESEMTPVNPQAEIHVDLDDAHDPDPLDEGGIDVGELVTEHLSLAINPYPRKGDAEFSPVVEDDGKTDGKREDNPFAVLAKLRRQDD